MRQRLAQEQHGLRLPVQSVTKHSVGGGSQPRTWPGLARLVAVLEGPTTLAVTPL